MTSRSESARIQAIYDRWLLRLEAAPETEPARPQKIGSRYSTDPEFREYRKRMSRQNYYRRKKRKEQAGGKNKNDKTNR